MVSTCGVSLFLPPQPVGAFLPATANTKARPPIITMMRKLFMYTSMQSSILAIGLMFVTPLPAKSVLVCSALALAFLVVAVVLERREKVNL